MRPRWFTSWIFSMNLQEFSLVTWTIFAFSFQNSFIELARPSLRRAFAKIFTRNFIFSKSSQICFNSQGSIYSFTFIAFSTISKLHPLNLKRNYHDNQSIITVKERSLKSFWYQVSYPWDSPSILAPFSGP